MILEFHKGDRVREAIEAAEQAWGPLPFREGHTQGWRLCSDSDRGFLVPLHVEDEIPVSRREATSLLKRPQGEEGEQKRGYSRFDIFHVLGGDLRIAKDGKSRWDEKHFVEFADGGLLDWPSSDEEVDIRLCVILAISGG